MEINLAPRNSPVSFRMPLSLGHFDSTIMKTLQTLLLAALLFLSASAVRAVNVSEGADFPNASAGAPYVLTFGTNTFSGSVSTPSDGQDRFDVTVPAGMRITSATKTFAAGGGVSGANISFAAEDLSGTGAGTFVNNYPLGPATYSCIVNANFSVGNAWSVTFTVESLVTWTTSNVTGPGDVVSSGTLIGAMNVGRNAAETIGGVTFAADTGATDTPIPMGGATVQFSFGSTHNDFMVETDIGGSTQYAAALDYGRWRDDVSSGTVTLGGLTAGRTYQVQLWITDSRGCCNTRTRTVDGVATSSAGPQIATGTFTASGTTQGITIAGVVGGHGPQLNLLQLREPVVLVQPAAITSSTSATDFYPASQLINGSGLSATPTVTNLGTHAEAGLGNTAWVTEGTSTDYFSNHSAPVLTCTLPGGRNITELVIWPYNFFAGTANGNEAKIFDVAFSTDGTTFTNTVTVTSPTPLVSNGLRLPLGTPLFATHVRVTITDNHYLAAAGGDRVGLGEIRFVATPEIYVTNTADSGPGSLRQALADAAATPGSNTILFGSSFNGEVADTITLTSTELTVNDTDGVTIDASAVTGGVTISGNSARRIFNITGGTVAMRRIHLTGGNGSGGGVPANYGGAIQTAGTLTLTECSISASAAFAGGAIFNVGGTQLLTLTRCTLSGNNASYGGAIQNEAVLAATQSTFSGNFAATNGGAISSPFGKPVSLVHCTVSNNQATGLGGGGTGSAFSLNNTILAGNTDTTAGTSSDNLDGTPALSGANLTSGDPILGALADNGGQTKTMRLLHGSPAINAASGSTITSDQRGRAIIGTGDIGAYENQRPSFSTQPASQMVGEGTPNLVVPFTVTDDESTPAQLTMVELKKNTIVVPGATFGGSGANRTVTLPGPFTPADNGALYTVTISDGTATRVSSTFTLTVISDTTPPTLNNVAVSGNRLTLTLTFSEPMSPASAGDRFNYNVSGGIVINAAQANGAVVTLTLGTALAFNTSYTLSTNNVTDQASTPNTINPNPTNTPLFVYQPLVTTSAGDTSPGSLRQVVANAPTGTVITFAPALAGQTITLGGELLVDASRAITLDASEVTGGVKLDGNNATRLASVAAGASLTLKNLTLTRGNGSGGNGGAISTAGTVVAEDCTFSANAATGVGGAIFSSGGSTLTLTRCTVAGNTVSYEGGGVRSTAATLTATNCTFTGNTAVIGGALSIADGGPAATLTQCTVAGNTATGVTVPGPLNAGGGGLFFYGKDATIANCLVAGNSSQTGFGVDVEAVGGVFTLSGNVIGNNDTVAAIFPAGPLVGTTAAPLAARLAPLANNGGRTQTLSLLPGSPALDAGVATAATTDQRGFTRSRDGNAVAGALPDAGAYEAQIAPAPGIGFNMGDAAVNGGDVLGATELAGVFPQANWNHLAGNANSGGLTPDTTTRLDASGAALPGLKLWWKGPNTWRIGNLADSADKKLMFGYLDSNAAGDGSAATDLFNNASAQPYVAIAGLPAILGGYRVLVYADGDATDGRVGSYWLGSNTGQNPANVSPEAPLTPRVFLRDAANFTTTYTRATGTSDTGATTPAGNYVQFDNLTETAFTVRAEEHAFRAPINAVQIVRNEIVVVTTAADENDPVGTLGTGISLREAIRDAAPGSGIVFDSTLNGAILTPGTELVLGKNVTIDATNLPGGITLSGGGAHRIFAVNGGQTVALLGFTLTGGNGTGSFVNNAGGAVYNTGTLALDRCTLVGNTSTLVGGALYNNGVMTVTRSTLASNSSDFGGGILNYGTLTVTHSTISGNTATANGGGIDNGNGTTIVLTLANSIVAGNTASTGADINNFNGTVTRDGANLVQSFAGVAATGTGTISNAAPLLAPLGNYGGPTLTMPPLTGSPAINASVGSTSTTDQRGLPVVGVPDIGATEASLAAPLVVTTNANTGPGSLRETMQAAGIPGAIVNFAPALNAATITLASEITMPVTGAVTIDASTLTSGVTISGGGVTRIFSVGSGKSLTLKNLTLTAGNGTGALFNGYGGAIYNAGTLALTDCVLHANVVPSGRVGGGIFTLGAGTSLTATRCLFINNATSGGSGGGSGIYADSSSVVICTDSTFTGNTSPNTAGAIHSNGSANVTARRCTFNANTAVGVGSGAGAVRATNATFLLEQCTLTANTAGTEGGAAICTGTSVMTLRHCTLNGNSASDGGGVKFSGGTLNVENSLIAGNTATTGPDIHFTSGTLNRLGANVIGINATVTTAFPAGTPHVNGSYVGTAASPVLAQLAPLGNYGGLTQTMALALGSPARNASISSTATADQRSFPIIGTADIGAYETGNNLTTNYNVWIYETLPATATAPQHASTFDFDSDGQTNNAEWLALTNPANSNSRFTMSISPISGGNLPFSFQTAVGRNYQIEYSTDLASWTSLGTITDTGGIHSSAAGPVTGFTKFFIRMRASLPP